MASIMHSLFLSIFFAFLLFPNPTFSADSPEFSPSPSPHLPPQLISPPPESPSPSPALPNSPPSPPPSDLAPNSPSPAVDDGVSSEHKSSPSPSPAPDVSADISLENQTNVGELEAHSGGMNGGQKAGIAVGVIAGASIVGIGAVVYKKRQQNIRRSEVAYTTRREIL